MKLLLINPPDDLEALLGAGANLVTPFEPLGLLYVAAYARQQGFEVEVIDAYVEKLALPTLLERIRQSAPQVVGLTTFTSNGAMVYRIGKAIKESLPGIFVVLGNVHAGVYAQAYLANGCCDAVVHGEGELAMAALLRTLADGKREFAHIPELSWMHNGLFQPHRQAGVMTGLDTLPLPARDLVQREHYKTPEFNILPADGDIVGKHLFSSRGCPYRCTFCVVHSSQKVRGASPERVVDEMEFLMREYGANYLFFMDSLFTAHRKRVTAICEEIRARNLKIRWGCEAHVRTIDAELVRTMAAAGCHDMSFGIESGVQRLLDNVKKGATLATTVEAIRTVKRHSDIKISGLFILGLPGESEPDSLETIRFATSLPLDTAQFSILVPYPGSPLFQELVAKNAIDTGLRPDGSLDTSVWLRYSAYISYTDNEPIWVTPGMTGAQLKRLQKQAVRAFYFRPRQFWNQARRIRLSQLPKVAHTFIKTFF